MSKFDTEQKKDIFVWLDWFNAKWNNYEAFVDFERGSNPKEVAENFLDHNKNEFLQVLDSLDKDDLDALDQMQKLTESEAHVLKLIKDYFESSNKVRYVDFKNKIF